MGFINKLSDFFINRTYILIYQFQNYNEFFFNYNEDILYLLQFTVFSHCIFQRLDVY
jgi:hypothetical protein